MWLCTCAGARAPCVTCVRALLGRLEHECVVSSAARMRAWAGIEGREGRALPPRCITTRARAGLRLSAQSGAKAVRPGLGPQSV